MSGTAVDTLCGRNVTLVARRSNLIWYHWGWAQYISGVSTDQLLLEQCSLFDIKFRPPGISWHNRHIFSCRLLFMCLWILSSNIARFQWLVILFSFYHYGLLTHLVLFCLGIFVYSRSFFCVSIYLNICAESNVF